MTATTLEHALSYAARGWHVFVLSASKMPIALCEPCRAEHTTPAAMEACEHLTCHGFYAATTDPARIAAMLERHPRGLLAIRSGAVSGLAVVDVDIRDWSGGVPAVTDPGWRTMGELDRERLLPGTLMQTTGSGGLHFLYAHPGGYLMSGAAKYGPGVDSKADGGYIVAAPSVSRSGPYSWTGDGRHDHPLTPLPEGLAARVRPPEPVKRRETVSPWARPSTSSRLTGLVQTVLDSQPGNRSDRLHWAAMKAGEMVTAGEVEERVAVEVLTEAALSVGLTAREIGDAHRGTVASGMRKGLVA